MNFNNILFLDIETVSQYETYHHMPEDWQELWNLKAEIITRGKDVTPDEVYERAGIYAEFGKIVCISCGCIQGQGDNRVMQINFCAHTMERSLTILTYAAE
jgi:hypothetical protein